mmetsp:Transcript_60981/g.157257  ORF Transcript_60981/g.157257 Transcript_60981/m.157257 type:complete len:452 (+) Transcript_60981:42-1397(+)
MADDHLDPQALRQRRGAGGAKDGQQASSDYDSKAKPAVSDRTLLIGLGSLVLIAPLLAVVFIKFLRPHTEISTLAEKPKVHAGFDKEEVRQHLRNHTLLHIGGLHRSGTTKLWEGLQLYSDISSLGHQEHTDKRVAGWIKKVYNEGIFLQRVYPKFGLEHDKFLLRKWIGQAAKMLPFVDETVFSWVRLREGVGRFALNPDHHLDESSPLVQDAAQTALFNQWAIFWDLTRPVLLEKSPSNIVISPFLHRLWGLGLEDGASPARFIFMRRHPIAVAMATLRAGGATVSDLSVMDLVENWVLAEERLAKDLNQYFEMGAGAAGATGKTYRTLTLEAMVKAPGKSLEDIATWLGLQPNPEAVAAFDKTSHKDPNAKYFVRYCGSLMSGKAQEKRIKKHAALVRKFGARVKAVEPSYDLERIVDTCRHTLLGPAKTAPDAAVAEEEEEEGPDMA